MIERCTSTAAANRSSQASIVCTNYRHVHDHVYIRRYDCRERERNIPIRSWCSPSQWLLGQSSLRAQVTMRKGVNCPAAVIINPKA